MTTPTVQRTPGTASRKQRDRIIATLIRHTGNQDLSRVRPRADATNRVPAPITHRGCPMNRLTCPNRRSGVGASGHNQTLRNPDGRWGAMIFFLW
jgi:hypothetical protein